MSFLAPLLEIQNLDLAADATRTRVAELPERKKLPKLAKRYTALEGEIAASQAERVQIEQTEEEIGKAVAVIVKEIEAAEVERYSGKRKGRDEAEKHEAAQQVLREKQEGLENDELALLESMEALEGKLEQQRVDLATVRTEGQAVTAAIAKEEATAAAELEGLGKKRAEFASAVPEDVMAAYERLRAQPRSGGRGAAAFEDGSCAGCRISLPSLEKSRFLAEPEEALIQCPQCRRVLVRS